MKADPHFYRPDGRTGAPCGACSEQIAQLTSGKSQNIKIMPEDEHQKNATLREMTLEE